MEAQQQHSRGATLGSWIQYLGMTVSMIGGAKWPSPTWSLVGGGLLILGVGIFIARRAQKSSQTQQQSGSTQSTENIVRTSVDAALARTIALFADGKVTASQATADEADAIVRECVEAVAKEQERLTQKYGFAGYASVMTPLASGERWLFRAWSAASDQHHAEVRASLESAINSLRDAQLAARQLLR